MSEVLNNSILILSVLLLSCVLLSKSLQKFGVPVLILFLGIGMISGPEGLGFIAHHSYDFTHSISIIAICLIIFSGGLMTNMEHIKPILHTGVSLSTFGVLHTTIFVGSFCYYFLDLAFYECLLIGAILSSTDAAAVFTAFAGKKIHIRKRVRTLLELESASNDPMTYLLVTVFLGLFQAELSSNTETLQLIIINPVVGFIGGIAIFQLFKFINEKIELDFEGLYPALTLGFLFLTYSAVTKFDGNGFLAVYIFAIKMGNTKLNHKKSLTQFFDGLAWLSQIGLFLLLGLLVSPSRLIDVAPQASVIALFLIFVGRPLSMAFSTFFSELDFKEKIFVSWGGLKGATPIVFASLVATQMGSQTNIIFDIVFFTVVFSAILQGSTIKILAKKLGLTYEPTTSPDFYKNLNIINLANQGIKEVQISASLEDETKRLIDLNLPSGVLVLYINRDDEVLIPNGETCVLKNDKLLIFTPLKAQVPQIMSCFKGMVHIPNKKRQFNKFNSRKKAA